MNTCKNICATVPGVIQHETGGGTGYKTHVRCTICRAWFPTLVDMALRCVCCGVMLRTKTRDSEYRKVLLANIRRN